ARAGVPLRVDGVVLVCQVLELRGLIAEQRVRVWPAQKAAGLLVSFVRRASKGLDGGEGTLFDADIAARPFAHVGSALAEPAGARNALTRRTFSPTSSVRNSDRCGRKPR